MPRKVAAALPSRLFAIGFLPRISYTYRRKAAPYYPEAGILPHQFGVRHANPSIGCRYLIGPNLVAGVSDRLVMGIATL